MTLIIPIENQTDSFVVGLGPSIAVVEWDGISNKTSAPKYVKLIDETPGNRLNDGKADATGRLWVGKYLFINILCPLKRAGKNYDSIKYNVLFKKFNGILKYMINKI